MKDGKRDEAEARRSEVTELKDRISELDHSRDLAEKRISDLISTLPNIPHETVPVGKDETANSEVRRWGTKPEFDFQPKDHVDLGTELGILDLDRAAKIAASRFAILNGDGARLERALINFMLDVHRNEHGYLETLPPFIVNRAALFGTGQLPKFEEDLFKLSDEREFVSGANSGGARYQLSSRRNSRHGRPAKEVGGLHAMFSFRSRKLWPGHARPDSAASV